MTCSMLLGVGYFKPVEAIDFSKNEAKYMSLCSSSQLTNDNKKTCESFNSYLKEKNKKHMHIVVCVFLLSKLNMFLKIIINSKF